MKDQKLLEIIRNKYVEAGNSYFPAKNIYRGTNHTISSFAEDAYAKYVSDIISNEFEVWIDPQITIDGVKNNSGNRKMLFRPDVCVVRKKNLRIEMLFDLKMDLGYNRTEFAKQVKNRIKQLNKIKNNTANCSLKKDQSIIFNENVIWTYIIISSGNIGDKDLSKVVDLFKDNEKAKLYTLSKGKHLNEKTNNGKIELSLKDFIDLRNSILAAVNTK